MPPMFKSSRPARSTAAKRLHVIPYRKYGTTNKAQPPSQSNKQQRDLVAVWRDAEALCAKLKGSK